MELHGEIAQLVPQHHDLLWLIPLFPLVGFVVNALFGTRIQRVFGKKAIHTIAIGAMVASWLVAVGCFVGMLQLPAGERLFHQNLWLLLDTGNGFRIDLGFALDPLSMMMVLIITTIGTLIHVYSVGYMAEDKSYWRFFAYLNLFVFAMLLLVMGENFAVMFFGWEGVGLASYLLIAFWYEDVEKAKAGMKAFVVNRIGDFGFLVGMFTLFWALAGAFGPVPGATPTLAFHELRDQFTSGGVGEALTHMKLWGLPILAVVGVGLFIGATGKSAQFPLFVWLPDAMAGPTPVSALIHAATMVTAGVYMVARLSFLFALSPSAMGWVALVGALTAAFAASIGFFQYDIKKVLAYSTVSQLGFMFIGVGVGAYWAGAYHLLTHAFFKAALFLGSGSVILACHHEQDMRKMGGLGKYMPTTQKTYLWACIAIAGFPIAGGFYSKDEILWKAFSQEHLALLGMPAAWLGPLIYCIGIITATGTAFYMFRSYYMTFTGEYRGGQGHDDAHGHGHSHTPKESPLSIISVLVVLSSGAVLASLIGLPAAWTNQPPILEHFLEPSLPATVHFAEHPRWMEWAFQIIGVSASAIGWLCARFLYLNGKSPVPAQLLLRYKRAWTVVYNKYYVDEIYQATVVRGSLVFARILSWIDSRLIDGVVNLAGEITRLVANLDGAIDKYLVDGAVNLVADSTIAAGRSLRRVQTGRIQTYLYGALAGALVVVLLNFLIR
jgi:NADH-quinone oxidoreductase subunit L